MNLTARDLHAEYMLSIHAIRILIGQMKFQIYSLNYITCDPFRFEETDFERIVRHMNWTVGLKNGNRKF